MGKLDPQVLKVETNYRIWLDINDRVTNVAEIKDIYQLTPKQVERLAKETAKFMDEYINKKIRKFKTNG